MKVKPHKLLADMIVIFCLSTLTYKFWPSINKILAVFIILLAVYFTTKSARRKNILISLGVITVFFFSLLMTNDINQNINDFIYWAITIFFLTALSDRVFIRALSASIIASDRLIWFTILVGNLILVSSFFVGSSYTSVWNGHYFLGFAYSQHSVCCGSCILLVLVLFYCRNKELNVRNMMLFLPGSLAILQSGARTFLVSLIVIWAFVFFDMIKRKSLRVLIFPLVVLAGAYLFINTGMMDKFLYTSSNKYSSSDKWVSLSSGRLEFWLIDLKAYFNYGLLRKLIGSGFSYVYELNKAEYGLYIWAHNDIINVLVSCGFVGLLTYIKPVLNVLQNVGKIPMRKVEKIMLIIYLVFPLLLNGLYAYQHYLYSFVILYVYCYVKSVNEY